MIGDILQHLFIGLRIKTPLNARFNNPAMGHITDWKHRWYVGWNLKFPTIYCRFIPYILFLPPSISSCQTQTEGWQSSRSPVAWGRCRQTHVFRKVMCWRSVSVAPNRQINLFGH